MFRARRVVGAGDPRPDTHEPEGRTPMRDGRRLIANIGSLLDGSAADRERLVAAGAVVAEGRGGTEDDLVASCADAEVVMGLGQFPFTERVFESLPRLEFLMQCTVGYDRVDVDAATRHGVLVANSPLFCIEEVSDHAVMLLMACARKLPQQVHASAATAGAVLPRWRRWGPCSACAGRRSASSASGRSRA